MDMHKEDTSVERILRKVKNNLKEGHSYNYSEITSTPKPKNPTGCNNENVPQFENLNLESELFFQTDYIAKIYDPRNIAANTRFLGVKKLLMRVMRLYATRQVEFNASVVKVINLFLDKFQEIVAIFSYFRQAEVRLQNRIENAENMLASKEQIILNLRLRLERIEEKTRTIINDNIERIESLEEINRNNKNTMRLEKLEEIYRNNKNTTRLDKLEEFQRQNLNFNRIETIEEVNRINDKRITNIENLRESLKYAIAENSVLRKRLDKLLASNLTAGEISANMANTTAQNSENQRQKLLNDNLYFPIFNKDRGIEEIIHQHTQKYVPFFEPVAELKDKYVLDIGCGRGEFIEDCQDAKIKVKGIDINHDMVEHCLNKKLDVVAEDAIEYLANLADNSLAGIISCHVIEHLTSPELMTFIRLCSQKIAPKGKLLLETPNPSSFFALSLFYRDFTHEKPIHPELLKLSLENLGFEAVIVEPTSPTPRELLLSEDVDPKMENNIKNLNALLYGHLDYAVMAIKPADAL